MRTAVLALGNFDGVHRGHQAVIRAAVDKAHAMNLSAHVLTFEPHPRALFQPNVAPFRLTPAADKERLLRALGIRHVIVQPFTKAFADLSADDFIDRVLREELDAQHVVAGFDFVFGKNRTGHMDLLRQKFGPLGVTPVPHITDEAGKAYSSSRTREALRKGDLETAAHILGRPWSLSGVIRQGAQRGRTIGVPTANMGLGDYLRPKFGVYAITARQVGTEKLWRGVANIGARPTVDGQTETLEFHLFDFNADIYGETWDVALHFFIRPEQTFSGLDALRQQIEKDCVTAKDVLSLLTP